MSTNRSLRSRMGLTRNQSSDSPSPADRGQEAEPPTTDADRGREAEPPTANAATSTTTERSRDWFCRQRGVA